VVLAGDTMSAVGSGLTLPFFLVYLSRVRDIDLAVAGLALSTVALAGLAATRWAARSPTGSVPSALWSAACSWPPAARSP
jgi:hypothetical protein